MKKILILTCLIFITLMTCCFANGENDLNGNDYVIETFYPASIYSNELSIYENDNIVDRILKMKLYLNPKNLNIINECTSQREGLTVKIAFKNNNNDFTIIDVDDSKSLEFKTKKVTTMIYGCVFIVLIVISFFTINYFLSKITEKKDI